MSRSSLPFPAVPSVVAHGLRDLIPVLVLMATIIGGPIAAAEILRAIWRLL